MTVSAEPPRQGNVPYLARFATDEARGLLSGVGAFFIWGCAPVYFKWLSHVSPIEIAAHRAVWSLLFVAIIVMMTGRGRQIAEIFRAPRTLAVFVVTTLLIGSNWMLYIWAIANERILEGSLGYYINPLVNVLLGLLFLGERLNRWQGVAILFAVVAVAIMTMQLGFLPWVSLYLAFSFGFYGLFRKKVAVDSTVGLTVETILMFPLALGFLLYLTFAVQPMSPGAAPVGFHHDAWTLVLLAGTGIVTAVPLILFATAARHLTLTTLGLLQYMSPTLQALLAVFLYHEPFGEPRMLAFGLIWIGLIIYSVDGSRRRHAAAMAGKAP